ncbi:MAG TPA: hypothetical protein VF412_12575 [Bdellovibrio sp.]|uniref:hypothetical protein n=1 Tax=Bdellovibrio sp. TaxID=28201 RepID=UPI002F0FF1A6
MFKKNLPEVSGPWKFKDEEIAQNLCSNNVEVIQELFSMAKDLRNEESDRSKALDSKAASLFGLLGILGSAALLAISTKSDQPFFTVMNSPIGSLLIILSLICMATSLIFIFLSVRVRAAFIAPGEADLIGGVHAHDEPDTNRNEQPQDGHKYRRFLIEHFWKLYKAAFEKNESKAALLAWGQNFLFTALLMIVALQIYAVIWMFPMSKNMPDPKQSTSTPQQQTVTTRPAPMPQSSSGTKVTESMERPSPLRASSQGQSTRLSQGPVPKGTGDKK